MRRRDDRAPRETRHSAGRLARFTGAPATMLAFATLALTVGSGCQSSSPPNIVLITVDTLRADRLTPYGYEQIETPAIERLAREGIVFERAYADTSWTLPSLSSVMTGKYPTRHLVRTWNDKLHDDHDTIAEILKRRGYHTAAIVGSYPLDRSFGLAQGFDYYDDEMTEALFEGHAGDTPQKQPQALPADADPATRAIWQMQREFGSAYRTDRKVADEAIEWLDSNRATPFFLWVHFFGPHEKGKRAGLAGEAQRAQIAKHVAAYDGDVEEADRQVGRFLDALRQDPRFSSTALIFHSDHGQSLKEHGMFGHGFDLYDTTVHVPLIVRLPSGKRAGERVDRIVRNLDIFATVVELARADAASYDSHPLLAAPPAEAAHAYLETHSLMSFSTRDTDVDERERKVGRILRGVRAGKHKLVADIPTLAASEDRDDPLPEDFVEKGTKWRLFDIEQDRQERRNLLLSHKADVAALRHLLESHQDESEGVAATPSTLDEAAKERLRALGYEP